MKFGKNTYLVTLNHRVFTIDADHYQVDEERHLRFYATVDNGTNEFGRASYKHNEIGAVYGWESIKMIASRDGDS